MEMKSNLFSRVEVSSFDFLTKKKVQATKQHPFFTPNQIAQPNQPTRPINKTINQGELVFFLKLSSQTSPLVDGFGFF